MKKIFTLLCAAGLLVSTSATAAITKTTVTKDSELKSAIETSATTNPGDIAYIYIQGSINLKGYTFPSTTRNIHFVGVNDSETGERATLLFELVPPSNKEGDKFAITFENLTIKDNNGEWSNSKHLINFKDALHHFADTIAFRNCEITSICRSLYRGEPYINTGKSFKDQNLTPPTGKSETEKPTGWADVPNYTTEGAAGKIGLFEMSNCIIHNGSRQSKAMPLIYMSQPTSVMTLKNNTFYDLTYLNSIVTFAFMTEDFGRQDIKFNFENNTVCAYSKSTLLNFGEYVGGNSEFHIKNNFFLFPNWTDDSNNRVGDTKDKHDMSEDANEYDEVTGATTYGYMKDEEILARIEKGTVLTNITSGLAQVEYNVMYGYKNQDMTATIESGDVIPIGDTEEEEVDFTSLAMADVPFAWSDFVDAQNDKFQINNQNPAYTAGKNGAPIGDINNYTDQVIKAINVSAKVEGSNTVSVSVSPVKEKYFTGDQVTITLNDHNTALRTINTFKGWNDGSEETTRVITLEADDIDLTATYEPTVENIISAFDFAVTPTVGQNKLTSYAADVYATGNQAVAKMFYVPNIVENEVVTGVGETYQAADGTENRFNWRSGKFGEDDADKQVCVLSRKTAPAARKANKPDYIQFELSTTGLTGIEFSAFCGTDNYGYKTQLADYSLDGTTWTNFAKVDMVSRDAEYSIGEGVLWGWTELKGTLPAAAENQAKVYIRVIGDTTGEKAENGVTEISEESNMFEYLASVLITSGNAVDGIKTVSSKNDAKAEAIYNLMGIKVKGNKSGLYIKGNKKFVK